MKYLHPNFLLRQDAVLLVVDIQEKLFPIICEEGRANQEKNVPVLLSIANELGLPTVITEQYSKGLGHTIKPIKKHMKGFPVFEKMHFAATEEIGFSDLMASQHRQQVVVCGMETHICVYQTVLGLKHLGYEVHLVQDACGSRFPENHKCGLEMARDAGAIVTNTESVMFQLLEESGTPEFKMLQKLII